MGTLKSTGKPAALRAAAGIVVTRQLHLHLWELTRRLRTVHSTINTSVSALRAQNADIDADVARTLQRCGGDPLGVEIERMEVLLRVPLTGEVRV